MSAAKNTATKKPVSNSPVPNTSVPNTSIPNTKDQYAHEGAVEQDAPNQSSNTSMNGQMGHRNKPDDLDTLDTDFPEPGQNPEHSGE
jgi:hypothetical protein